MTDKLHVDSTDRLPSSSSHSRIPLAGRFRRSGDARNAALGNVDILTSVFEAFDVEEDILCPDERLALASAARVCHAFAYAALPRLWRWLHNFAPLWNILLPHDVPSKSSWQLEASYKDQVKLIKAVTDAKLYQEAQRWERFLRYASYVRHLDQSCYMDGETDLLLSVIAHNGGITFLPALKCLKWVQRINSGEALFAMSSGSIVELHLCDSSIGTCHTDVFAAHLSEYFPALRTLKFMELTRAPCSTINVITSFTGISHLRSLHVDSFHRSMDYTTLRQIFTSLPLEELHFRLADLDVFCPHGSISAPYLRHLDSVGIVANIVALLSNLRAPSLVSLEFHHERSTDHAPTTEQLWSLCTILSEVPCSRTLTSLSLNMRPSRYGVAELTVVSLLDHVLQPVLSMAQLERLSFVFPVEGVARFPVLQDEDVAQLARALPNLRYLEILSGRCTSHTHADRSTPGSCLSSMSLVSLARYCPYLEELRLQCLKSGLADMADCELAPVRAHPLRLLVIRNRSWLSGYHAHSWEQGYDYTDAVLRYLDALFPKLRVTESLSVMPRSLQPDNSWTYLRGGSEWMRCEGVGSRNIFVHV